MRRADGSGVAAGVPTGLVWRKSSRSNGDGNVCVEIARMAAGTGVRDSKNPDVALVIPASGWGAFLRTLATTF